MIIKCYNLIPSSEWEQLTYNKGDLLQSSYWANVLRSLDKAKPLFVRIFGSGNGELLAQALFFHKIPWDRQSRDYKNDIKSRFIRKGWIETYSEPLFFTEEPHEILRCQDAFIDWAENYAKKLGLLFINFNGTYRQKNINGRIELCFLKRRYKPQKWGTYLVDLSGAEEDIWKSISGASRKAVNKARREDISIKKVCTLEEFKSRYITSYSSFTGKHNTVNEDIYDVIWNEDKDGYYHYYLAVKNDVVVAVLGMYVFNGVATEIMSALSPYAYKNKLTAQDLLHWEMFLEAKKMGCVCFDLAGVNPEPKSRKEDGIKRFKSKWGGEYYEYYSYLKIRSKILATIYNYLNKRKAIG